MKRSPGALLNSREIFYNEAHNKKGDRRIMQNQIFQFVNQYITWGIFLVVFLGVILLWRMLRQQKKLNRELGLVTEKIREYFKVILTEEGAAEPKRTPVREVPRGERFLTNEEREILMARKREQAPVDEEVFNSVMQEFFS